MPRPYKTPNGKLLLAVHKSEWESDRKMAVLGKVLFVAGMPEDCILGALEGEPNSLFLWNEEASARIWHLFPVIEEIATEQMEIVEHGESITEMDTPTT